MGWVIYFVVGLLLALASKFKAGISFSYWLVFKVGIFLLWPLWVLYICYSVEYIQWPPYSGKLIWQRNPPPPSDRRQAVRATKG